MLNKLNKNEEVITTIEDIENCNADLKNMKYFAKKCDLLMVNHNALYSEIDRIRDTRLQELDIDWDEYEAHKEKTDFDTIITICETCLELLNV